MEWKEIEREAQINTMHYMISEMSRPWMDQPAERAPHSIGANFYFHNNISVEFLFFSALILSSFHYNFFKHI